jgi:hypothetical protein
MIQEKLKNNVKEISNDTVSTGFDIEINESMFQLLTANVYNDPILAVIREWSTNACDACIEGNKNIKFDVHLPTHEESYFSVRDYGTGLAPEDIVGLFSKLGASTKRNSNKLNGTFGIGRMAGLAVASGFTVESYHNSILHSYAISVQNGVPVTISLGNTPTTEPNGLRLSVTIEPNDISHYHTKAEKLYKYFDHKPNLNIDTLNIELDITEHISDDWFIKERDSTYDSSNHVVMSQVAYVIPPDSRIIDHDFHNLVIKAEPGTVSFNPGRESLSLTKETVEYLNNRLDQIKEEYVQAAIVAMSNGNTDKEVFQIYSKVTNNAPSQVSKDIIPDAFYSKYFLALQGKLSRNYIYSTSEFENLCDNKLHLHFKSSWYKHAKYANSHTYFRQEELFSPTHVIVDLKTKFKKALSLEFNNLSAIYWQRAEKVEIEDLVAEAKTALTALGLPYVLASDLVKKHEGEISNTDNPVLREGFYASSLNRYDNTFMRSQKISDSSSKAYLYVKLSNTTPIIQSTSYEFEDFLAIYNILSNFMEMPTIKGVAKKYQQYVDGLDNWLDFEDFILECAKNSKVKVPSLDTLPYFSSDLINCSTAANFPKPIEDYYNEIKDYKIFMRSNDFVSSDKYIDILKNAGTTTYTYEPTRDVDLDYVETTFKKTLFILSSNYSDFREHIDYVTDIAKLEEFYEVHSTK